MLTTVARTAASGVAGAIAASVLLLAGCGEAETSTDATQTTRTTATSERITVPRTTSTTQAAAPIAAPTVVSLFLSMVEDRNDFEVDAVDVAGSLVPARAGEPERGVFDSANWQVVAQCDAIVDDTLKVGVVKREEFSQIPNRSGVASNAHSGLLDCPE